ncbi:GDSL family lipase [Arsenicicoccus sp. oral taxon 190]|nr:GDSL family lipase [Arsenicicoccus sp. oral taxon 190]
MARMARGGGYGLVGAAGLGAASYGLLKAEARMVRRIVGKPFESAPPDSDVYGAGLGDPIELGILGDSLAAGLGVDHRRQTIGATLAHGISAIAGRPVRLTNAAVVGSESCDLDAQVDDLLQRAPAPDVVVVIVGGNDVTHRKDVAEAVGFLADAIRRLQGTDATVIVGTCPDLGTVEPLPQPLRWLVSRWSRDLAAAQTVAAVEAGARTVSLGDLIGPDFLAEPALMFSKDQFHPSAAGYARAASAILPSVAATLGLWPESDRPLEHARGEGVGPLHVAAVHAVAHPGTEVSAADRSVATSTRRAVLRRLRHPDVAGMRRPRTSRHTGQ